MKQWLSIFSAVLLAGTLAGGGWLALHHRAEKWNEAATRYQHTLKSSSEHFQNTGSDVGASMMMASLSVGWSHLRAEPYFFSKPIGLRLACDDALRRLNEFRKERGLPPVTEAEQFN